MLNIIVPSNKGLCLPAGQMFAIHHFNIKRFHVCSYEMQNIGKESYYTEGVVFIIFTFSEALLYFSFFLTDTKANVTPIMHTNASSIAYNTENTTPITHQKAQSHYMSTC